MMKRWTTLLLALLLSCTALLSGCAEMGIEAEDLLAIGGALLESAAEMEDSGFGLDDYGVGDYDYDDDDASYGAADYGTEKEILPPDDGTTVREDGEYSSKSEVGLYLYLYGHLPGNYITKDDAYDLGWDNKKGNLWEVAPGMSIGGDKFGNYEGLLPKGNQYYECDIDYEGGYRGSKRIVYSKDGYIYYTEDHYETFEQLYP